MKYYFAHLSINIIMEDTHSSFIITHYNILCIPYLTIYQSNASDQKFKRKSFEIHILFP